MAAIFIPEAQQGAFGALFARSLQPRRPTRRFSGLVYPLLRSQAPNKVHFGPYSSAPSAPDAQQGAFGALFTRYLRPRRPTRWFFDLVARERLRGEKKARPSRLPEGRETDRRLRRSRRLRRLRKLRCFQPFRILLRHLLNLRHSLHLQPCTYGTYGTSCASTLPRLAAFWALAFVAFANERITHPANSAIPLRTAGNGTRLAGPAPPPLRPAPRRGTSLSRTDNAGGSGSRKADSPAKALRPAE